MCVRLFIASNEGNSELVLCIEHKLIHLSDIMGK